MKYAPLLHLSPYFRVMVAVAWGLTALNAVAQPISPDRPIELFNGENLDGWILDLPGDTEGVYAIEDGILKLTGQPVGPIRTEADYTQYKLTLEWRWPEGIEGGNSGLLVHAGESKGPGKWPRSLEAQLRAGDAGDLVGIGGYAYRIEGEDAPRAGYKKNHTDGAEHAIGQWNTMVVVCDGTHVTVDVNGQRVHECWDCESAGGAIALQSEGKPIEFRTVRIEPVAVSPTETIDLFNGEDFTGWIFDSIDTDDRDQVYSIEDGVLRVSGTPKAVLRTTGYYRDYEFEVQWRWAGQGGNSGVLIHCSTPRNRNIWPKSLEVQLASANAGDFWMIGERVMVDDYEGRLRSQRRLLNLTDGSEKPLGEWNTMICQVSGDTVKVFVNGELVNAGRDISVSEGAICLQSESQPIEFRKVQIRPLPAE